jgi:hypothetical protein
LIGDESADGADSDAAGKRSPRDANTAAQAFAEALQKDAENERVLASLTLHRDRDLTAPSRPCLCATGKADSALVASLS